METRAHQGNPECRQTLQTTPPTTRYQGSHEKFRTKSFVAILPGTWPRSVWSRVAPIVGWVTAATGWVLSLQPQDGFQFYRHPHKISGSKPGEIPERPRCEVVEEFLAPHCFTVVLRGFGGPATLKNQTATKSQFVAVCFFRLPNPSITIVKRCGARNFPTTS